LDYKGNNGRIKVIEYPIGLLNGQNDTTFHSEKYYQEILFQNPVLVYENLRSIQMEFRTPYGGSADILMMSDGELVFIELKRCPNELSDDMMESWTDQLITYVEKTRKFFNVINRRIKISGILIILINNPDRVDYDYGYKKTIVDTKYVSQIIKRMRSEKMALELTLTRLKAKIKNSEKKLDKVELRIINLSQKEDKQIDFLNKVRVQPISIILKELSSYRDVAIAKVKDSNINKVEALLLKTKTQFLVESERGYNVNQKYNKGKEAIFYFSYDIPGTTLKKITKMSSMRRIKPFRGVLN